MISILYNQNDYEAATIALKVQALAQNSDEKIYIVPKHFGRIPINVETNLKKTKVAIFISHDVHKMDEETETELKFLTDKKIPIQFVVPNNFPEGTLSKYGNSRIHKYHANSKNQVITDLSDYIGKVGSKNQITPQKTTKKDNADVASAIILVGLFLILLALTSTSSSKNK